MSPQRKLRLLVIGPTPPPYHGVATFIRDLLNTSSSKVELLHVDTSDRRDAENIGRWDGENLRIGFSNLAELAARLVRENIDCVYVPISQNIPAFARDALFILEARARGCRVVVQLHGGYFRTLYDQAPAAFQSLARAALNSAAAVIVLGEGFRPIFSGIVPESRIHVVENGVPDSGAWALRQNNRSEIPRVLYMSTLTRTKGILDLIEAVALVREKQPLQLRIAGAWADAEIERDGRLLIENLKMQEFIEFAGTVDGASKTAFLSAGEVFCLPTRYAYEGQPLVLLEAMAAGLPVVSTRHGVIGSTVVDGQTGLLLPKEFQPRELAASIEALLQDESRRTSMGEAARQRYLQNYTLESCHGRLLDLVAQVCDA
ncbi:MAG TPA: glycosyltransferase family 4 protein [Planctomycetota bacterium]|nr:glycosyltransferase family 4 protein [Planctomycetota bacterium]